MGNINVYSGPMKSGKTQEILNEYKRQLIAGRSVQMFKPLIELIFLLYLLRESLI